MKGIDHFGVQKVHQMVILKRGLKEMEWEYVDWICVTQDPMEGTCELGNERLSYQNGGGKLTD